MIKLKNPINHKGLIIGEGEVISLPADREEDLIKAGMAEKYPPKIEKKKAHK